MVESGQCNSIEISCWLGDAPEHTPVRTMNGITIAFVTAVFLVSLIPAHGDMGVLEGYKEKNWQPYMAQMSGVQGAGVVVSNLPICEDQKFLKSVQNVLDKYVYTKKYKLGNFDCTNSSQIAWYILKQNGFDARLMYSNEIAIGRKDKNTQDFSGHVWVIVPEKKYTGGNYEQYIYHDSGGWVPVESIENYSKHLGQAYESAQPMGWYKPNYGWLFNTSSEYSLLTGDYYQLGSNGLDITEKT